MMNAMYIALQEEKNIKETHSKVVPVAYVHTHLLTTLV